MLEPKVTKCQQVGDVLSYQLMLAWLANCAYKLYSYNTQTHLPANQFQTFSNFTNKIHIICQITSLKCNKDTNRVQRSYSVARCSLADS